MHGIKPIEKMPGNTVSAFAIIGCDKRHAQGSEELHEHHAPEKLDGGLE